MITLVNAEDWIGVYIDGKLVYEYHDLEPETLLDLIEVIKYNSVWADEEWFNKCSSLPKKLSDVKLEVE